MSGENPFLVMLQIAFIVLKLCGVIDWSWWWILSPTLLPLSIAAIIFVLTLLAIEMDSK